jgi:hypothetical protein
LLDLDKLAFDAFLFDFLSSFAVPFVFFFSLVFDAFFVPADEEVGPAGECRGTIGCATLVDGWRGAADCDAAAHVGDGATGCATLVNVVRLAGECRGTDGALVVALGDGDA